MADKIIREVDYDFGNLHVSPSGAVNIAHRAKKLDEVTQQFFARHPKAVGLDLGAGLDSRVLRITAPPQAGWYDSTFPRSLPRGGKCCRIGRPRTEWALI